jgi:Gpi18-like mannosyltransferase
MQQIAIRGAPAVRPELWLGALLVVLLPFYRWCWAASPPDMAEFLIPWYRHIVETGRLAAFAEPFSNYTPPYLYLLSAATLFDGLAEPQTIIRSLSLLITAALGLSLRALLLAAGTERRVADLSTFAPFLLPSAIINAAMLGQCDALWSAPCLMAVAAALRRKPGQMLTWCGVAFAIKAQSAFIAPFALGALLGMRASLRVWLVAPAAYLACLVPALMLGWPIEHILSVYLRQSQHFAGQASVSAANPWLMLTYAGVARPALILPLASGLALLAGIGVTAVTRTAQLSQLLRLALLSALAMPFLLPQMHERFFFLADMLGLALALTNRDARSIILAALVQLGSLLSLLAYITGETALRLEAGLGTPVLAIGAFLCFTAALVLLIRDTVSRRALTR